MFNLINYQEDLANRMLAMKSFRIAFSKDKDNGFASRGRDRNWYAETQKLIEIGYTRSQALAIYKDTLDYAKLIYHARIGKGCKG